MVVRMKIVVFLQKNYFMKHIIIVIYLGCLLCSITYSQSNTFDKNEEIFNSYIQNINNETSLDSLFIKTALYYVNTPYDYSSCNMSEVKILENVNETYYPSGYVSRDESEKLIVNLQEMDCVTFIENCLALYLAVLSDSTSFDMFKQQLQKIRYRNGIINGYTSRLHYTLDWIYDNTSKGIILDKTQQMGGNKLSIKLNYMSNHNQYYEHLINHPTDIQKIKKIEKEISYRSCYYYIPKEFVSSKQLYIKTGDIICFTTSIEGLDVSHMGIAYWENDKILTFIHASKSHEKGKVIVNQQSIHDYCISRKSITGIIVLRLHDSCTNN